MSGVVSSYGGDPNSSMKDRVRWLMGDTGTTGEFFANDSEILFALVIQPNAWKAGALVAESLAAKAANDVNTSIGDLREEAASRQEKWERVAAMLRGDNGLTGAASNPPAGEGGGVLPANTPMLFVGGLDEPRAFDFREERLRDAELYGQPTRRPRAPNTYPPFE